MVSEQSAFDDYIIEDCQIEDAVSMDAMDATSSNTECTQTIDHCENTSSVLSDIETPRRADAKSRKQSGATSQDNSDILREFLNHKPPNPIDFLPPKPSEPKDNLQQFFEAIAGTMRTFSPVSIAKIKLKISQIVGEAEIANAEEKAASNLGFIYTTHIQTEEEKAAESNDSPIPINYDNDE